MARHNQNEHNGNADTHSQLGFTSSDGNSPALGEIAANPLSFRPYFELFHRIHGRIKRDRLFPREHGMSSMKVALIGRAFDPNYFSLRPQDRDHREIWGVSCCLFWGEAPPDTTPEIIGAIQFGHATNAGEHVAVIAVEEIRAAGADIAWVPTERNILHCVITHPHNGHSELDSRIRERLSALCRISAGLDITSMGAAFARAAQRRSQ